MSSMLRGLYVITDSQLTPSNTLIPKVEQAIMGGARLVQFRDKTTDWRGMQAQAQDLATLCEQYGIPLIINDHLELAVSCGAHGVHLGKDDVSITEARRQLGQQAIIGVSCYNNLDRALQAQAEGASYVAFGSFFPSQTKPNAVKADLGLLRRAKNILSIPICGIGGINLENAGLLIDAGADMLAVVREVFAYPDPQLIAHKFNRLFEKNSSSSVGQFSL